MRRSIAAFTSVLAGTFCMLALPGAAHADTISPLPISGFYQIVADSAHNHLFLSQGSGENGILVTDLAGNKVTTIPDTAEGMALSPDGSTLYVTLPGADAVSAISTTTLTQTARYPLGTGDSPRDVVVQSGALWVSYTGSGSTGAIGEIDLSAAPASAFTPQAVPGTWQAGAPLLAADPSDGGALVGVLSQKGTTATWVASYNVSGPITVYAQPSQPLSVNCDNASDLAVAPGGAEFVLACGAPYEHYRYSTTTLNQLGYYPSNAYPTAVAITATGMVAAGIADGAAAGVADIYVYPSDASTALNTYAITTDTDTLAPRGLAWSASGSQLFAVLQTPNASSSTYSLQVLYPPLESTRLYLYGASTVTYGTAISPIGQLYIGSSLASTPFPVTVTRTLAGSGSTTTFTVKTGANGAFTFADKPPVAGTYTYAATYGGSDTDAPATASYTVTVTRAPATLSVTTGAANFNYHSTVKVTAHLGATSTNRTVSIYAQWFGHKGKTLLKTGLVNAAGNLTVSYAPPFSTTFSVVFAGDAKYAPRTVTRAVYVRAQVNASITGYFKTIRIGGILYRVYHHTATQRLNVTVAPNKAGECVKAEGQIFAQGAWQPDLTTGCGILSKASTTYGLFGLSQVTGFLLRVRADYIRGSTDNTNLSNDSGWLYFEVVK